MSGSSKRSHNQSYLERLLAEKDERIKSLEAVLEKNADRLERIEAELEKDRHAREKRERRGVFYEARSGIVGLVAGAPLTFALSAVKGAIVHRTISPGVLIFLIVYLAFISIFAFVGVRMVKDASRALKAASQKGRMATYAVRFLFSFAVAFGLVMTAFTKPSAQLWITGSAFYRILLIGAGISLLYNYALMRKLKKATGEEVPTFRQMAEWAVGGKT